jgi:hypothetical protein
MRKLEAAAKAESYSDVELLWPEIKTELLHLADDVQHFLSEN